MAASDSRAKIALPIAEGITFISSLDWECGLVSMKRRI